MTQTPDGELESEVAQLCAQLDAEVTARGASYAYVAQKAGLQRGVVSLVLRQAGRYEPKLLTLVKIAKALGFEVRVRLMRIGPH